MAERIAYRGRIPAEAAKLSAEAYLSTVKSRQRRWLKRNSLQLRKLNEKVARVIASGNRKPIKTQTREALILPSWVGIQFDIYNGKEYQRLTIEPNMLGHRLGEFVYSTRRVQHSAPGIKATRGSKFLSQK
ncbi:ribosomal protein S19 family protein [Candidatus Marsarchaeota archaeon]|nr:ribosomal protein S19 family protein [Candidatus Marsarchaeota archaeon]MCL5404851.1 ribosomal protein S19 family protein [Candidatus Marsarchaeota archaeon]